MENQAAPPAEDPPDLGRANQGSYLFTVRLWREEVTGGQEYRGTVHEVATGAFLSFRNWPDLGAFIVERMDDQTARMAAVRQPDRRLGRNEAEERSSG